jgi:hypothetical protein
MNLVIMDKMYAAGTAIAAHTGSWSMFLSFLLGVENL